MLCHINKQGSIYLSLYSRYICQKEVSDKDDKMHSLRKNVKCTYSLRQSYMAQIQVYLHTSKYSLKSSTYKQKQHANLIKDLIFFISLGQTGSISNLHVCLSSSSTMEYILSGLLSAVVVSWCASAYHLPTALQGFSRTSRMSLDTLWAFLSHTAFSSDRFLIMPFSCTSTLLCM